MRRLGWEWQNTYKKGKSQDLSNCGLELVVHKTSVLGARKNEGRLQSCAKLRHDGLSFCWRKTEIMEALWTEWCMFGRTPRKNSEGKHRAQGLRSARTVLFLVLPIPIFLEKTCTSGRTLVAPGCRGATQTVAMRDVLPQSF